MFCVVLFSLSLLVSVLVVLEPAFWLQNLPPILILISALTDQ